MARALINMAVCTGGISVGDIGLTGGILNVADTDWLNGMHGGRDDGERKTEDAKIARAHLIDLVGQQRAEGAHEFTIQALHPFERRRGQRKE